MSIMTDIHSAINNFNFHFVNPTVKCVVLDIQSELGMHFFTYIFLNPFSFPPKDFLSLQY